MESEVEAKVVAGEVALGAHVLLLIPHSLLLHLLREDSAGPPASDRSHDQSVAGAAGRSPDRRAMLPPTAESCGRHLAPAGPGN